MFTDEQAEEAVRFIWGKSDEWGKACGHIDYCKENIKVVFAQLYDGVESGTVQAKDAAVRNSPRYYQAILDIENAVSDRHTLHMKLKAAEMQKDVWQTQSVNKRMGVV